MRHLAKAPVENTEKEKDKASGVSAAQPSSSADKQLLTRQNAKLPLDEINEMVTTRKHTLRGRSISNETAKETNVNAEKSLTIHDVSVIFISLHCRQKQRTNMLTQIFGKHFKPLFLLFVRLCRATLTPHRVNRLFRWCGLCRPNQL